MSKFCILTDAKVKKKFLSHCLVSCGFLRSMQAVLCYRGHDPPLLLAETHWQLDCTVLPGKGSLPNHVSNGSVLQDEKRGCCNSIPCSMPLHHKERIHIKQSLIYCKYIYVYILIFWCTFGQTVCLCRALYLSSSKK